MISHCSLRIAAVAALSAFIPTVLPAAYIGYTSNQAPDSAVILSVRAEYIALEVRIRCDEDDWTLRMDAIYAARQALESAVVAAGLELDSNRPFSFKETYKGSGSSSFSFFSFSSEASLQPGSVSRILVPITEKTETLAVMRQVKALVDGLKVAKKTSVALGDVRLALKDPESRRTPLLAAIDKHLRQTQGALNASANEIEKLDGPLQLSQTDEYTIAVFLPFQAAYSADKTNR